MMTRNYLLTLLLCFSAATIALAQKQPQQPTERQWYNRAAKGDSVYGVATDQAYQYIRQQKLKPRKQPVVALIGGGMDMSHADLRGVFDEKAAWDFIGGSNGAVMNRLTREGEREFLRLQAKYADYIFDGKQYYKIVDGKRQPVPQPDNMEEYNYFTRRVLPESQIGHAYGGWKFSYVIEEYMDIFDREMKQRFPGKELTVQEFQTCYDPKAERDSLSEVSFVLAGYAFSVYKTNRWEVVRKNMSRSIETTHKEYLNALEKYGNDDRKKIVGDNPYDIRDKKYGNDVLLTDDAAVGTMEAGIIAARRGNGIGIDGIADRAKIIPLRIATTTGEPYLKDMALAIRRALTAGADIIVLPEQNTLYPPQGMAWMIDALAEAEKRGALVIVPVWSLSTDMDHTTFYPNRNMRSGQELKNILIVAASDEKGNPLMTVNYGAHSVDLFAPGAEMYTTYTGNTYRGGTGTGLAAATVAGVAALVKTYYPKLNGAQLRDLLMRCVSSRKGVEVEKGILVDGKPTQDLFLFDDLCVSGGIVNARQALEEAGR
jgi:subtilisin family serine protease